MQQEQIKNITQHCYNFPNMRKPIVMRDNILDTIDRLFNSTSVVYIEGEENVGKTIIAAQFAEKHQTNSFCLFIKGSNNIGSNIPVLRTDLYSQINYYLINAIPEKESIISPDGYIEILYRLTKHCRMQDREIYFVIDGIDNVEDFVTQKTILDLFPIGNTDRFKFLIVSGNQKIKDLHHLIALRNETGAKSFIISNFTEGEALKLFEEYEHVTPDEVKTIFKNFKKPGELTTIFRLLENSDDPKRILEDPITNLGDLFFTTWSNNEIDIDSENILAALAFNKSFHSPEYIAALCDVPVAVVNKTVERITFLEFDQDEQQIGYISEGFLKYAANRLESYQTKIYEKSLRLLLHTPDDMNTVQQAPFYYNKLGQYEKLSDYLTADRLMSVFKGTKSESQTISIIKDGFGAACSIRHDQNAFAMSLLESVSNIFTSSAASEKEIQARAMLGDFEKAMKVARQAKTKEDKLLLLSQLMMWQAKKGLAPDELTIDEIKMLHVGIDYSIIKEKAVRISTYLLYTLPDLAVDIIERLGNAAKGESSTDVAIARITMSGIVSEQSNEIDLLDVDNSLIKNSIVKNVYSELRALLKHQPVNQVLNEIDNMDSKSSKLLFLRNWLVIHKEEDIDGSATQKAMELSIEALGYNLTASILRDISSALPYINKATDKAAYIEWFDRQISALTSIDICNDYVELQLNLAKAQIEHNKELALSRIQDAIFWSEDLDDLSIQVECLAIIKRGVIELEKNYHFDQEEEFSDECQCQIERCVQRLIISTADHLEVFLNLIRILALFDCKYALKIINQLNTPERRDNLREEIIYTILSQSQNGESIDVIEDVLCTFEDRTFLSIILSKIARRMRKSKEACTTNRKLVNRVIDQQTVNEIIDSGHLCIYWSSVMLIRTHLGIITEGLASHIFDSICNSWESILSSDEKISVGFDTVYILADQYPNFAIELISRIEEYKKHDLPLTRKEINAYSLLIKLLIRGLSGLSKNSMTTPLDYNKLNLFISGIPSAYIRCILWSDYILAINNSSQKERIREVFDEKIMPVINEFSDKNLLMKYSLIVKCAPSYFISHETLFLDSIKICPVSVFNSALFEICTYIMTKTSPSDPFEISKKAKYAFAYADIPLLFSLINRLTDESIAYSIINRICSYVVSNPRLFNRFQRIDISSKIDSVIKTVFLCKYPISHKGYKLCTLIQSEMINDAKVKKDFQIVKNDISDIPNIADQSFIWCEMATAAKQQTERRDCFNKAKDLVDQAPSLFDKVWHIEMIANLAWHSGEKQFSKDCLSEAMQLVISGKDKERETSACKRIISLAHRLDPELARTLSSVFENEAKTEQSKVETKNQKTEIAVLDSIIEQKGIKEHLSSNVDFSKITWEALGLLNAGMINPSKLRLLFDYYQIAATASLLYSYPIYSWIIENVVQIYSDGNNCSTIVRPLTNSLISACEYCVAYLSYLHELSLSPTNNSECSIEGIVKVGDRKKYIVLLKEWLNENAVDDLVIVDPYFVMDDLEIVKYAYIANDSITITIVTSSQNQKDKGIDLESIEEVYCDYWRDHFSLKQLQNVKLVLLSAEPSGKSPIHDRWIISGDNGIHLGTSINSIGQKMSGANIECKRVIDDIKAEIDSYINGKRKSYSDEKIRCRIYNL